jgi:poly(ADP-ribose) glycohydrolase
MLASYKLPSHPTITSLDPLSLTEIDDPSAWAVVTASITTFQATHSTFWDLPNLIKDLAYSLYNNGHVDTGYLLRFLTSTYPNPSSSASRQILDAILDSALELPNLFPTQEIPYLSDSNTSLELDREQVNTLVAHQILGTLKPPVGNTWGCTFLCWYSEPQPHERAVHGYLTTVFRSFSTRQPLASSATIYEFSSIPPTLDFWDTCDALVFDHLIIEPTTVTSVKFPHGTVSCMLVSSNTSPGFGSSSTQEELITGACPALLPFGALLFSPPIPNNAVLLASGVTPLTKWQGQGRDAQQVETLDTKMKYTFLLLDALELDLAEPLPTLVDLVPRNIHRELHKAFTGFSAVKNHDITDIAAPLWGTGAFGGDSIVKTIILAMAGARAGVRVWLSVNDAWTYPPRQGDDGDSRLINILLNLKEECGTMTVGELWRILMTDSARSCLDGRDAARLLVHNGS